MKVLMINGSPHAKGNTYLALQETAAKFAARYIMHRLMQPWWRF